MTALRESEPNLCPDGGTCHHLCPLGVDPQGHLTGLPCFRVVTCGPLSIAKFPGDRWPDDLRAVHIEAWNQAERDT